MRRLLQVLIEMLENPTSHIIPDLRVFCECTTLPNPTLPYYADQPEDQCTLRQGLEFLYNLSAFNETRKLQQWLHLFGAPSSMHSLISNGGKHTENPKKAEKLLSFGPGVNMRLYTPGFMTKAPLMLLPDEIRPLLKILRGGIATSCSSSEFGPG